VVDITLNLCCCGLQEVGKAEHLEMTLVKYEITYRESVGDLSLSIHVLGLFMSVLGSSTSWGDIGPPHTYMNVTYPSSSRTIWGDAPNSSKSSLGPFMSWGSY